MSEVACRVSFLPQCIFISHSIIYIQDGGLIEWKYPKKAIYYCRLFTLYTPEPAFCSWFFSTSFISVRLRCCAVTLLPQLPEALSPHGIVRFSSVCICDYPCACRSLSVILALQHLHNSVWNDLSGSQLRIFLSENSTLLYTEQMACIYHLLQHPANEMITIDGPHPLRRHFLQHHQPLKTQQLGQ